MTNKALAARRPLDPRSGSKTGLQITPTKPQARRPAARGSRQLPLSPALRTQQGRELKRRISRHVVGSVTVTVTDNKAVMISVQRTPKRKEYAVRLHHLFVEAPEPIIGALARYVVHNDRQASRELNNFIDHRQDQIRPSRKPESAPVIHTAGRYYDLQALFDELNQRYFSGAVRGAITWGRQAGRPRARQSIRLGSYCVEQDLIRIHPGLDQRWIPLFYIRWVIFHEMLHAVHPIPVVNGRRRYHTQQFSRNERRFDDYQTATEWERRNVASLLCI